MVKVILVAWYFMHLRFANRWIRLMMVPALVLSAVVIIALDPRYCVSAPVTRSDVAADRALFDQLPVDPVNRSYRLGLLDRDLHHPGVARGWSLDRSQAVCIASASQSGWARPSAVKPTRWGRTRFTERSGRTITDADLAGEVWVADFIFTRCPSSCPRITFVMKGLQRSSPGRSGGKLVSISVDPNL